MENGNSEKFIPLRNSEWHSENNIFVYIVFHYQKLEYSYSVLLIIIKSILLQSLGFHRSYLII